MTINASVVVVERTQNCRPTGPPWEVQITTFQDVHSGQNYEWWSDKVFEVEPEVKVGDCYEMKGRVRNGYDENPHLSHVRLDRMGWKKRKKLRLF